MLNGIIVRFGSKQPLCYFTIIPRVVPFILFVMLTVFFFVYLHSIHIVLSGYHIIIVYYCYLNVFAFQLYYCIELLSYYYYCTIINVCVFCCTIICYYSLLLSYNNNNNGRQPLLLLLFHVSCRSCVVSFVVSFMCRSRVLHVLFISCPSYCSSPRHKSVAIRAALVVLPAT